MVYIKILFLISLIESIYIFYMFNFFKTTIYFHHPLERRIQNRCNNEKKLSNLIMHPMNDDKYSSKICPLGNIAGCLLPFWIMFILYTTSNKNQPNFNRYIYLNLFCWLTVGIIAGMLNLNAFIYLIPCFIFELISLIIKKKKVK